LRFFCFFGGTRTGEREDVFEFRPLVIIVILSIAQNPGMRN
jgi:hypothetical protein